MSRALLVFAACVTAVVSWAIQTNEKSVDPAWLVPEKAIAQKNPYAGRPELASGGGKLFARMCTSCHGDESHPQKNGAPDLRSEAVQKESDGALFWRISNGNSRKGMPSFSGIPEVQRWQLVMYIRTLRADTPPAK